MRRILRRLERLADVFLWLSIVAGIAMMLHVVADVTGRYFFNRPYAGTTEIVSGWYMVAVAFLPWAWIARHDQHIVAGMFQQLGSPRVEHWLEIACKIVTAVFIALFVWQTMREAIAQTRAGEVLQAANMYVPIWPSRWLLPASGALMVAYLALRVIHDVAQGPQDKQAHPPVEIA
jgi:TRAP-type C4-dicarboxylate transport system permease small subunit